MKLNTAAVNIETSEGLEGKVFSIGDAGLLFDILRSKMYSNPILAICREYVCNAIDSHREAGKPDEPIQICLPNNLEAYYKIKDFGVGISPDRMENIFIKYGNSTKREDNIQMGAFGLGAKCAFSMVDSFAVNTIYNGVAYKYACVIDETKVGKLFLLSQSKTKENNGTEIVIPVEPKDFGNFNTWTEHVGRHLKVKPIIKGGTIAWQTIKPILEGKGWAISNSNKTYYEHQAKAIIDGIEYPLTLDSLRTYADTKLIDACTGHIMMHFGIGELTLSSSREQIYLDKKTKDKISQRLQEMQKDIKKLLLDKIDAFPNLWQANIYYRKELHSVFTNLGVFGKLEWKGIPLHNGWVQVSCPAFTFTRGKYSRKTGMDPNKLNRSRMTSVHFEENSELFVNDLPIKEPTPRHVKKAFEDNPKLNSIHVLCPTDTITEVALNKCLNLDKMAPRRISELTKVSGRAYTPPSSRLLVFKYDPDCSGFRQVSYASIEEDTNDKVLCLLSKQDYPPITRLPYIKKSQAISFNSMNVIADKSPKTSFYGVDQELPKDRVEEEFGDFEPLEKYINRQFIDNKNINYVEIKFAKQHYRVDKYVIDNLPALTKLIVDPNSLFLRRAALHQKIQDINAGDTGLLQVYETIKGEIFKKETEQFLKDNPEWNIDLLNKEYEDTYPLLDSIDNYVHYSDIVAHVAQYINLIDTHNKDQKKKKD